MTIEIDLPADLPPFRLPDAVAARLQSLLDRQDSGQPLTTHMISSGDSAFMSAATCSRAFSSASRARRPDWCNDDGLPQDSAKKGFIASNTSGNTGVVA